MSVQAITAALAIRDITSAEKFLLVVLANYADQNMRCWPSQERLAADMAVSTRNLVRLFKNLEMCGWVSRQPRGRRADGSRTSSMIILHLHSDTMSLRTTTHSDTVASSIVTPCHSHSDTMSPKPSLKNQKEEPSSHAREAARSPPECGALLSREDGKRLMKDLASTLANRKRP